VGDINLFDGELQAQDGHRLTIATRDAGTLVAIGPRDAVSGRNVSVAIRPEKVKLMRRGSVDEANHGRAMNRLEGRVTDVCYLGRSTTYKVRLDAGGTIQSATANTARLDVDAYLVDQPVVAWFTPDDCVVLEQ